jgi:protein associated with RNAse G/E
MPAIPQSFYDITEGLVYYSESDNPYTIDSLESITIDQVPFEIAVQHSASEGIIKQLDVDMFFQHVIAAADPNDLVFVLNAKKTEALYHFLKENLSGLTVFRIESGVRIPIYIVGALQNGSLVAIKTISVET